MIPARFHFVAFLAAPVANALLLSTAAFEARVAHGRLLALGAVLLAAEAVMYNRLLRRRGVRMVGRTLAASVLGTVLASGVYFVVLMFVWLLVASWMGKLS